MGNRWNNDIGLGFFSFWWSCLTLRFNCIAISWTLLPTNIPFGFASRHDHWLRRYMSKMGGVIWPLLRKISLFSFLFSLKYFQYFQDNCVSMILFVTRSAGRKVSPRYLCHHIDSSLILFEDTDSPANGEFSPKSFKPPKHSPSVQPYWISCQSTIPSQLISHKIWLKPRPLFITSNVISQPTVSSSTIFYFMFVSNTNIYVI